MASQKRKFEPETGQVYSESSSKATLDLTWLRGPDNPIDNIPVSASRTPTLRELSMRSILCNLSTIPAESLKGFPWHLASAVWREAKERGLDHFTCWRAFATAFPQKTRLRWRPLDISVPEGPLQSYLCHLNAPCTRWLTCLTISTKYTTKADLIRLPRMLDNLVSLELIPAPSGQHDYSCTIDNRLLKAWAELIRASPQRNYLGSLRVLVLRQPHDLTPECLASLQEIPNLVIVVVQFRLGQKNRLDFDVAFSRQGWMVEAPKEFRYMAVENALAGGRFSHAYGMMLLQSEALDDSHCSDVNYRFLRGPCVDFSFGRHWRNRGALHRSDSIFPDHPYPPPQLRSQLRTFSTACYFKLLEAPKQPQSMETPQSSPKQEQPPQRRMKPRGGDLASLLSSFSNPPTMPSARHGPNRR